MDAGEVSFRHRTPPGSGAGRDLLLRALRPSSASRTGPGARECLLGMDLPSPESEELLELGEISGLVEAAAGSRCTSRASVQSARGPPSCSSAGAGRRSAAEASSRSPVCTAQRCSRSGTPRSWSTTARGVAACSIRNLWPSCSSPSAGSPSSDEESPPGWTPLPPRRPQSLRVGRRRPFTCWARPLLRLLRPAHVALVRVLGGGGGRGGRGHLLRLG